MNHAVAGAMKAQVVTASRRLSPVAAFFLLGSITSSFLAGSSAPSPLYPTYMAEWGLSAITVTLIFAIYAVAVLLALLIAGRVSDHVGRRPVLLIATAFQAFVMVLFATATGLVGLLVARVVQGLTTGAAVTAVGAAMIDLDKARGTVANAVAPPFGTALGAILAGAFVQFLPFPTVLVYAVLSLVFAAQGLALIFMRDSISPRPGVLASLKPQFSLPRATRAPLLLALPALVAVWALAGFYGSLAPVLVRHMMGSSSPLLGGLSLFVLAASGGIAVLLLQRTQARQMLTLGALSLLAGVAITIIATSQSSPALFFLGTTVAGVGFGAGFQGAIRSVVAFAAPHERAGVLAIVFIICYLSMGVPAVAAGWMVARHGDIFSTAQAFGAVVMALALMALLGSLFQGLTKRKK